jgi:hypothetical protein
VFFLENFHTAATTTRPPKNGNKKERRKGGAKLLKTNVQNHHVLRLKNKVQKLSYLDNEFLDILKDFYFAD